MPTLALEVHQIIKLQPIINGLCDSYGWTLHSPDGWTSLLEWQFAHLNNLDSNRGKR